MAGSRDSAYIATTSSLDNTLAIAVAYYSNPNFTWNLYLYRMNTDSSFYELRHSIDYLEEWGTESSAAELAIAQFEHEIVTQRVLSQNII